ncbi:hypothetical protein QQ045_029656 [Rhodiola kirilowii]
MLQRAASSAYSWWWASHIRTKQSKWLEQNLQDMEDNVGSMLNIIDEDGDSFARRAEMYYRKRPELVHLVEESFRAYRALAERYDHISRDLQSANRTIATVYPEKVHFSAMEDEDDEEHGFSKKLAKPVKAEDNAASKPPIPKVPMKSFKPLPTLRTKRAQQKQLKRTRSSAKAVPYSGLSKGEALEEIDKLQKGILALQTEKEFVKSSYENAIAKYLEIENRINEMQVKVCGLQDEFGIGTVIEDNEARKLMASSALKSCQETLNRLKEKQETLVNEASIERGKIKEAQQKLQAFKDEFCGEQSDKQELEEINKLPSKYQSVTNPDHMAHALQSFDGNSKELEDVDWNNSLTVTELVDKIDDVVDKVVNLETDVASSTAMVKRLRSEAGELQEHVQALEKTVEGSDIVRQKMVKLEIEMARVQSLNRTVEDQNISLSTHFAQASYSLDQIAEKVENSKFNEIGEIAGWSVAGNDDSAENHLKTPEWRKGDKFLNVVSQLLSTSSDKPQAIKSLDADKEGESSESVGQGHENIMLAANGLCVSEELELEQKRSDELLGVSEGCEASCTQGGTVEIILNAKSGEVRKDGEDLRKLMNDKLSNSSPEDAVQLGVLQREQIAENEVQPVKLILPEVAEDDRMQYPLSVQDKCHDVDESCVEHRIDDLEEKQNVKKFKLESAEPSIPAPNANTVSDSLPEDQEKEKLKLEPSAATGGGSGSRWRKLLEDAEGELDWRRLFLSGLEDREKFLVDEYTSVINKLKETRRKLSEVEKKNKAGLTDQASKMKQILHANSLKDKEIQSLRRTLSLLMINTGEKDAIPLPGTSQSEQNEEAKPEEPELLLFSDLGQRTANDAIENTLEETQPARLEINLNDELHFVSSLEEKFRSDLDEMLGENLEFWLRFCTSVHQIQKFQSSIEDLQIEAARLMESKKQGTNTKNLESLKSDAKPIYKHLKEIQSELNLWLQHNSLLKEELESRHSSLTDIQEDITRLSNATEDSELSEYQAAKFQGEVANMKQENNKVADELQSCLGRVRSLHTDIDRTLARLNEEFGICETERKHSRSRIPLRTFLFGVRLKKQKQSFFRCISPSLQKQYSDLASQFPPPR